MNPTDDRDLDARIRETEARVEVVKATGGEFVEQGLINTAGAVGTAIGGSVGALLSGPLGAAVGSALGGVALTSGAAAWVRFYEQARAHVENRRAAQFFEAAACARVTVPEEPEARRRFVNSLHARLRDALESFDDAVVPALVAMLNEIEDRPREPFLRSFARVLRDLSAEEYADLRTLTGWILARLPEDWPKSSRRVVVFEHVFNGERAFCRDGERHSPVLNTARVCPWPPPLESWPLLAARLRAEGVFDRVTLERVDDRPADALSVEALHTMGRVLDVQPTPGPPPT